LRVEHTVFVISKLGLHTDNAGQTSLGTGRRLPYATGRVSAGIKAGHESARRKVGRAGFLQWIGGCYPGEVKRGFDRIVTGNAWIRLGWCCQRVERTLLWAVGDQERAAVVAKLLQVGEHGGRGLAGNTEEIEQVNAVQVIDAPRAARGHQC